MKKLIFVVAAALVAVSASAQVGVIAGITSTKSDYKEAWASINEVTQYHVGATLKFPLPFGLAVQPSVIYNVKGTSIEALKGEDVSAFKTDSKTGILEIPVQVQWGVSIADVVRPYVFAEPFVGVAINGENKVDLAGLVDTEDKAEWDNLKDRIEYGFGVGVGVEVLSHLQVAVRYFWNLGGLYGTDDEGNSKPVASTNPKDYVNIAQNQKVSGVMASVAFLF